MLENNTTSVLLDQNFNLRQGETQHSHTVHSKELSRIQAVYVDSCLKFVDAELQLSRAQTTRDCLKSQLAAQTEYLDSITLR
jgi:hypothetical protein